MITAIRFDDDSLEFLDQRRLPAEISWRRIDDVRGVADGIREMVVRGAPAIGIAAAYGMALAAHAARQSQPEAFAAALEEAGRMLKASRPTAVNLSWAVSRVLGVAERAQEDALDPSEIAQRLRDEAVAIHEEDVEMNRAIGRHGSLLVPEGARILTHCNAGALATGGYGTALGVIRAAVEEGKKISVLADETRPYLQGARLTTWELQQDEIPVTLITDSMAGHLMSRGEVDLVIVGSDRIALNGDVANKIGTYTVAVLARRHGVPFYVAAPTSTVDPDCPSGDEIPIEERSPEEVLNIGGEPIAPEGISALHPAFDVTPAELVTAIITEQGLSRAPYEKSLALALGLEIEVEPAPEAVSESLQEQELAEEGLRESAESMDQIPESDPALDSDKEEGPQEEAETPL